MMRSLYSGISGLVNHQTRMDVIANNIANVNTIGYKRSRTVFQDIFSQTAKQGSAGTDRLGGTNPAQIGLGIKLSSVNVIHTSSSIARSDYPLDLMIEGDGFFILNTQIAGRIPPTLYDDNGTADPSDDIPFEPGSGYEGTGFVYYTRAGDFALDNNGMIVSSHGYYLMGYVLQEDPANAGQYIIDDSELRAIDTTGYLDVAIDEKGCVWGIDATGIKVQFAIIPVGTFPNNPGLERAGNSLFRQTGASGDVTVDFSGNPGIGVIRSGGTEMSNVDLATEFTDMIVTQRGFQANSRIITVSDTMLEELVNLKR